MAGGPFDDVIPKTQQEVGMKMRTAARAAGPAFCGTSTQASPPKARGSPCSEGRVSRDYPLPLAEFP